MRKLLLTTSIFLALLASLATGAEATTVTVGAPLSGTFFPGSCSGDCTILGTGSAPSYSSPVDGVIVRWGISGGAAGSPYRLRVFTPGASGAYMAAGTSAVASPTGTGVETFATRLPIKAGQTIGIDLEATAPLGLYGGAGSYTFIEPHPADGETQTPGTPTGGEWAYDAEIQPVPKITAISPTAGTTAGGTQVSIAGTDLEGTTAVRFGSTPATGFSIDSENLITAVAPVGSGAVPISVTTIAGTATSVQSFEFTAPPNISPTIAPSPISIPAPACTVPKLRGKSLKASKKRIKGADCKVGKLTKKKGAKASTGKVVGQSRKPGTVLPAGTVVKVTLGKG
jgi:hypothetical protein